MGRRPAMVQLLLFGLATVISLLTLSGCSGSTKTSTSGVDESAKESISDTQPGEDEALTPPQEEKWRKVMELAGRGQADTGPFEITTDQYWRITVRRQGGKTPFVASVYAVGDAPETAVHHGQVTGSGDGPDSLNFTENGSFFVRMESDAQPWRVLVEEIELVYPE